MMKSNPLELALVSLGFLSIANWLVAVLLAGWIAYRYLSAVKRAVDNLRDVQ